MVGIASLAPQQGQQAPGQAPMPGMGQPMPGMMPKPGAATPAAEVSQYAGMPLPQLIALFQQRPSGPLLGVITKQAEALELQKKMADQAAIAQAQQQQGTVKDMAIGKALQAMRPTQMAAHGGIMHGYAGGGAVAFTKGGVSEDLRDDESLPVMERIRRAQLRQASGDTSLVERPLLDTLLARMRGESPAVSRAAPAAAPVAAAQAEAPSARPDIPRFTSQELERFVKTPAPSPAPGAPAPTGGQRQVGSGQRQSKPNTGLGALASAVEQTGTPAPDTLSSIEAEARAQSEGLKKLLAAQGQVDPRIIAARTEAAELAQRGISEREKRAAGALEAAGLPLSQSLLDNQEALFRMLGAMKGGKRLGDAFSSIGQEAGAIRGEQRKALEAAQRENRLEQNAIDQLRQAQADLKLAQTTGDVTGERSAALKVEEAKANLINTLFNIQKERAAEKDRVEQREIQRGQLAVQQQQARTAAAQAARDPEEIRTMRALGIPTTAEGFKTYAEIKATGRLEGVEGRNNAEALRQLGQWEKDVGANIKAMNAKNPQVYEDARRAKIQEINATLGATIPLGGRAGEEPPPNIKALLNKYGS